MAWYDNLQYPDYAGHYKRQGDIYSNLLNSLSKIGGEYLTQQREETDKKKFAEDLDKKNYTTPKIPAVYSNQLDYEKYGKGAVQNMLISPEIPESFDNNAYMEKLGNYITNGSKTQQELANKLLNMIKVQQEMRAANLPSQFKARTDEDVWNINPNGTMDKIQNGVEKVDLPKTKDYYDINGNIQTVIEGQQQGEGFFSKEYIENLRKKEAYETKIKDDTTADATVRKQKLGDEKKKKTDDAEKEKLKSEMNNKENEKKYIRSQIDKNNLVLNKLNETKATSHRQSMIDSLRAENKKLNTKLDTYGMSGGSLNLDLNIRPR